MRVSEERLGAVLTRGDLAVGLAEANPVAGLIVESLAASDPEHSEGVRHAGRFFLDLVRANEPDATKLTLPVAMQTLSREELVSRHEMKEYLARIAAEDLLLGMSLDALLAGDRPVRERRAVIRVLYLLIRMFEAQEEADRLDREFERSGEAG
jgi:hypothetical protein